MTLTDKALDKQIAYLEKLIRECDPKYKWTIEKLSESLDYFIRQRARPRRKRAEFVKGSI